MEEELFYAVQLNEFCYVIKTRWTGRENWRAVYFGSNDWGVISRVGVYAKSIEGVKVDNRPSKRTPHKYEVKLTIPSADKNQGLTNTQIARISADFFHLHDLGIEEDFFSNHEVTLNGEHLGTAEGFRLDRIADFFSAYGEKLKHQQLAKELSEIIKEPPEVPF
jgi:hypothetical protein